MIEATIRYGYMMSINSILTDLTLRPGDKVIVRTDRGTELGEVVTVSEQIASSDNIDMRSPAKPEPPHASPDETGQNAQSDIPAGGEKAEGAVALDSSLTGKNVNSQDKERPRQQRPSRGPRVLRKAVKEDLAKVQDIYESIEPAQFRFCQQKIRELSVPMKLAAVERLFGGEKIIFYFLAESRVDFRALVRELAREYRTRIEMKQIGARDEAKLLGDYEHCGRELCCRRFMRSLEPITIRMAKSQKATLDPSKISGACGRLMCCLRFENPIYQQLKKQLPRKGGRVQTPKGTAEVINYDIIAQTVYVEESTGEKVTYKAEELSWDKKEHESSPEQGKSERSSRKNRSRPDNSTKPARQQKSQKNVPGPGNDTGKEGKPHLEENNSA